MIFNKQTRQRRKPRRGIELVGKLNARVSEMAAHVCRSSVWRVKANAKRIEFSPFYSKLLSTGDPVDLQSCEQKTSVLHVAFKNVKRGSCAILATAVVEH